MIDHWIPIHEIWKEKGIFPRFLVFSKKRGIECAEKWCDSLRSDSGADVTEKVTHYMYLPKPPKYINLNRV